MPRCYSFDVFDTCLIRTFARPEDLFFRLAAEMLDAAGRPRTKEDVVEIARLRREAEDRQRRASPHQDIGIVAIYEALGSLHGWDIDPDAMRRRELELERESSRPLEATLRRVRALRQRDPDQRILYISDSYIPSTFIGSLLDEAGFPVERGGVYVSGEVGLMKYTGDLFEHVLQREGLDARDLHHVGDHPRSDLRIPARMGIRAETISEGDLTRHERSALRARDGELWVPARIAGVSRAARLSLCGERRGPDVGPTVTGVFGPLFASYVAWVLHDASKRGLETLYFVSREGQRFLEIVEALRPHLDFPIPECRYLYGSRRAWLFPAITEPEKEQLEWLVRATMSAGPTLEKLELEPREVESTLRAVGLWGRLDEELQGKDQERLWELLAAPEVWDQVGKRAEEARKLALDYFEQEGLLGSDRWAMVDLGWSLNLQASLRKLLRSRGREDPVRGYYLFVAGERRSNGEVGQYRSFLISEEDPELMDFLWKRAAIFEEVFLMPDHGSVAGYRRDGDRIEPEFQSYEMGERRKNHLERLRAGLAVYATELGRSGLLPGHLKSIRVVALDGVRRFLSAPTREEVSSIGWVRCVRDATHARELSRPIARPLRMGEGLGKFVRRRFRRIRRFVPNRPPDYDWPEGSLALTPSFVRWLHESRPRRPLRAAARKLAGSIARRGRRDGPSTG